MSAGVWGRTWEDASAPSAARLTRRYEKAWREAEGTGSRPDPRAFLAGWPENGSFSGARLALLRTDMSLRWETGQHATADWYARRFPELGEDTVVALIYEEFCLLEEAGEAPDLDGFLERYPDHAEPLRRVLEIHDLLGNASAAGSDFDIDLDADPRDGSTAAGAAADARPRFPEAGDSLAGFRLVEELGRGSFARVFLARETKLADRAVALKVSLRGSREPQTLARLQHTHIVPVHSHSVDPATGMHVLCMPFFGWVTLGRLLAEVARDGDDAPTGADLVAALDRLEPAAAGSGPSPIRQELAARSFPLALAWWGARLAEALAHAHERGILHRDVKPSNVLIAADGSPMLLDFNLAHEEIASGESTAAAGLGGTVDYMAPEHLEALADGQGDEVDARADVFSLGVLLYEGLLGVKPFEPPKKGSASIVASLLDCADARRGDPRTLLPPEADLPAPLRAVLLRCLAPAPADRYQSAGELAEDLQAVADDLPLAFAREPLWSRIARRARRNRLRFATAALVLVSCAAAGAAAVNLNIERSGRRAEADQRLQRGEELMAKREYDKALVQFEAALKFAEGPPRGFVGRVFDWRNLRDLAERARVGLTDPDAFSDLERQEETAKEKARLARRHAAMRENAERIHRESEGLRMRFVGVVEGRAAAARELVELLKPFYVLGPNDWTRLDHNLSMLDDAERERLRREVDELLFLWIVGVERAADPARPEAAERIAAAVDVCDKALKFAGPSGPWLELRARLRRKAAGNQPSPRPDEPKPRDERSALACFQWGLLHSAAHQPDAAILWLRRAVRIDWSNYWYQYYLGYLEDGAGLRDEALIQYNVAAAVKPDSPWVLFSRARLLHKKGGWDQAREDMERALAMLGDRPESIPVRLELGYVHQALGDFARARGRYAEVLAAAPDGPFGRAARLNLANIAAESGDAATAMAGFGKLLASDPDDSAARLSRVLLDLRQGRAAAASRSLDELLERERRDDARGDLLATRAVVRMMLDRGGEAVDDARAARRLRPSPSRDRLVARALLAAGRIEDLQLDDPDAVSRFPLGGARLRADLIVCESRLAHAATIHPESAYRARLTRAAILSALGRDVEAMAVVAAALADSAGSSATAHLVAARIARRASDIDEAFRQVEVGLRRDPDDPALLELRGALRVEAGRPESALDDLDLATARSDSASAHAARAEALRALGRPGAALREWTEVIRRDPESPRGHLGRALCCLELPEPLYDPALVDLEQAASWSRDDPAVEVGVVLAYARCLRGRPDRLPRWLLLARRFVASQVGRARPWAPILAVVVPWTRPGGGT